MLPMAKGIHDGHRLRLKQQFLENGLDSFEPHQILELLLFYSIPQRDTNPLAHELINKFGSLPAVLDADYEKLCRVKGVGQHTATFLTLCGDLLHQYYKQKQQVIKRFLSDEDVVSFFKTQFLNIDHERVVLLCLNNRGDFLKSKIISEGTATATEVHVRTVVDTALRYNATAVVIAHNHPVGFTRPSTADINTTKQLLDALSVLDIQLVDHFIFAGEHYISMRKSPDIAPIFSKRARFRY